MTEERKFLDRLEYIKSELHFLLDEIVVIEDQVKNTEKNETDKILSSDVEMSQDIAMLRNLFKVYGSENITNNHLIESDGLAYGT